MANATGQGKHISAEINVVDTGIGIPKNKQHLIFKEFAQADNTTEKHFGGYGLGLTISKKLTNLLGGKLKVKSELGKGSTFSLRLPFEIAKTQLAKTEQGQYMNRKLRVLIIDDDTALLRMLKELMATTGITAHILSNFLQVEKDSHLDYDLVLTDIQMPQITGFEVLKRLKSGAYKHYKNQPIIAMTGRRDLQMDAYKSLGFAEVLQKPFSKKELIAMLRLLGLATEELKEEQTKADVSHTNERNVYDLDLIRSFLGENEDAINDVLRTFVADTDQNMAVLKAAVVKSSWAEINMTAHRMLPMFRQLKVKSVPILERMELVSPETMNKKGLAEDLKNLKGSVVELLNALEERLAISPTYNG